MSKYKSHKIELVQQTDTEDILNIYAPYIQNTVITFEYEVPSQKDFSQRISSICKTYPYLVYRIDGEIVGYAYASSYRSRAAFMWDVETSIYIKEDFHGHGIATTLYTALLEFLKVQGFHQVYAYIVYPNDKSVKLHEKFGFKKAGMYKKTGFKLGQWCDLIALEKTINESEAPTPYIPFSQLAPSIIADILAKTNDSLA